MSADLALINANVLTMNPCQPVVQAVAIKENRILRVGTNQEISPLIGEKTRVISLEGQTLVPGLIDTHIHVADFGRCLLWLDLNSAESITEVQSLLKEKASRIPVGVWIIGRGWNDKRFREKRFLTRSDLDEAVPDNPVILYHEAAMICAVNSKALAIAGLTEQTPELANGTIDKNPQTGELTGVLRDSATNLVWQVIPELTVEELSESTAQACQEIVKAGLTSIHWIILSENELSIIQRLHSHGKLPIRVNLIVPEEFLKQAMDFRSTDSSMLHVGGVLVAVDGYLDSKTAALSEPYSDESSNSGKLLLTEQKLTVSVAEILASGFQPIIHAVGDKAIGVVLRVIEQTYKQKSIRFRLEQAAVLSKALVERLRTQTFIITVQPKVISTEFAVWSATERLGIERARWLHPLKTLVDAGVKVAGGSDCPMEPLSPLLGMQEAVVRASFPEQRLSVEEALRMYTLDAAYASGEEDLKGSIEEGKLADLTVFSSDPLAGKPVEIKDVRVEMVIIDGKVVFPF